MTGVGTRSIAAVALVVAMTATACGGGDDDAAATSGSGDAGVAIAASTTIGGSGGGTEAGGNGGVDDVGAPTLDADAGSAWVEVDGERLEYTPVGSLYYECSITEDQVIVNFQTGEGHDLSVSGSIFDGRWVITASVNDGSGAEVGYGGQLQPGTGQLGIGDSALSYEGPVTRVQLSDRTQTEPTDARIAVNCGSPGDDPSVTVGGETFVVPFAGTQSIECSVAPGAIDIRVDRLSSDGLQIQISVRTEGSGQVGAVSLFTPTGSYTGVVPPDGAGLTVDGKTVDFAGTFTTPDGGEVDGTATVTCP